MVAPPARMRAPLLWLLAAAVVCLRLVVLLVVSHRASSERPRQDGAGRRAQSTGRPARLFDAPGAADHHEPLAVLQRLERYHSATPSRLVVVLGHKAQRDFPVYSFAFELLGYRALCAQAPLLIGPEPSSDLYYLAGPSGGQPVLLEGVAAVLCHSVLAYNCFRGLSSAPARPSQPPTPPRASDTLRVFGALRPGQRINRLAAARQALTTKDGLCAMLHQSALSHGQISSFTFPCWSLPREAAQLRAAALPTAGVAAGSNGSGGRVGVPFVERDPGLAETSSAAVGASSASVRTWIVKPARGSEGAGIQLLTTSQLLSLLDECYAGPSAVSGGDTAAGARGSAPEAKFGAGRGTCGLSKAGAAPRVPSGMAVASPYLASPLLRAGRKWDVRAYVLCTSVLPMRLYLFGDAIVRYASAPYSPTSSDRAAALTNTAVGKRQLNRGVGPITGTLEELARHLAGRRAGDRGGSGDLGGEGAAGAGGWDGEGEGRVRWRGEKGEGEEVQASAAADGPRRVESVFGGYAGLVGAMRRTVSCLFLTSEPQLARLYLSDARNRPTHPQPGGATADTGGAHALSRRRCSNCYHLFGVDLIAETSGQFLAIEVNVQPDLSLSRSGCAAEQPGAPAGRFQRGVGDAAGLARWAAQNWTEASGLQPCADSRHGAWHGAAAAAGDTPDGRCAHGSPSYDDTKRAVAFSIVQLVYSHRSAAATLHALLAPHAHTLGARFPKLAWKRPPANSAAADSAASAWDAAGPTGSGAASPDYSDADGSGAHSSGADHSGEEQLNAFGLEQEVLEYLLGAVREGLESGCFVPVIPSAHGWADQARHMRSLWRAAAARHGCDPPSSEGEATGGGVADGMCAGFDFERRRQMHALTRLVLGGAGEDAGIAPPQWRPPFRERCEQTLARVPAVPLGRWALRQHVFRTVHELDD